MHWLTKYINKKCHAHGDMQHGHIIQQPSLHKYTSGMPVNTKFTVTYVVWLLNNVAMLHITACVHAWHFLFMYFVSQCIHVLNHLLYSSARFPFRNLFMDSNSIMYRMKSECHHTQACPSPPPHNAVYLLCLGGRSTEAIQ